MSMIFQNRVNGELVPLVVEPQEAIKTLTESLHKALGAIGPISKAMHNLVVAIHDRKAGEAEATHAIHALSHGLMDLADVLIRSSPIYAFDPKVAQSWVNSESEYYVNAVLNPLLQRIQKDVDRENAKEIPEFEKLNAKVSELEAMVTAGQKPTMGQIMEAVSLINKARNSGQQTQGDQAPVDQSNSKRGHNRRS